MSTFTILMKTSGAMEHAIEEYAEGLFPAGDSEELDEQFNAKIREITEICSKWFKYGEYIKLRVNVEKETIEVVPCDE